MIFDIPYKLKNLGGVYVIRNTIDDRIYIGSTINFKVRFNNHRNCLRCEKHKSLKLQRFVNKYGLNTLVFSLIESVEDNTELLQREQFYLDTNVCYFNTNPNATNRLGAVLSDETKE